MDPELKVLYTLADSLTKELEAAIQALPVKQDLDAVKRIIARREEKGTSAKTPPPPPNAKKPRTLSDDKVKKTIVAWADKHFRQTGNEATGFRKLTDSMLTGGVHIPGNNPVFVVSGIITRNKKFSGKDGQWHLKEFAA